MGELIIAEESATPSTPASGDATVYVRDGTVYVLDAAGTDKAAGLQHDDGFAPGLFG